MRTLIFLLILMIPMNASKKNETKLDIYQNPKSLILEHQIAQKERDIELIIAEIKIIQREIEIKLHRKKMAEE